MRATDLLIWGIVIHLVIDWLAQNEWMAMNKAKQRTPDIGDRGIGVAGPRWWDRHPAAYVHAGMHGAAQLLVFPWPAALAIGATHFLIDTRVPVAWWSKLIRQTQPNAITLRDINSDWPGITLFDIGTTVRIWADQVWHIAVIALAALAVSL
jgi:hypothetical protein